MYISHLDINASRGLGPFETESARLALDRPRFAIRVGSGRIGRPEQSTRNV